MNVDEFLTNNKQKYEIFTQYQHMLNYLYDKEQLEEIYDFVESNQEIFFKDRASGILCIGLMNTLSYYNYWHFELICDVYIHFKDRFYQLNIDDSDVIQICQFPYVLYYLYTHSALSIESIAQSIYSQLQLLHPFYSDLKEYEPELIEKIMKSQKLEIIEFMQSAIENPEENNRNWSISYHPDPLHKYIRDDDLDSFQSYLSMNKVHINHKIPHSIYERTLTVDKDPLLIQIAAVYGSIKIFKFLWMQPHIQIPENLMCYAYSGRNIEIIHLCESKCDCSRAFRFAITSLQDELIEYYIENFKNNQSDDDNFYHSLDASELSAALESNNYAIIIPCLKQIVSLIPTGSISIRSVSAWDISLTNFLYSYLPKHDEYFYRYISCLDLHQFDFILKNASEKDVINLYQASLTNSSQTFLIQCFDRYKEFTKIYPTQLFAFALQYHNEIALIKLIQIIKESHIKIDFLSIDLIYLSYFHSLFSKKRVESILKNTEGLLDPDEKRSLISILSK